MKIRALAPIVGVLALAGCTQDGTQSNPSGTSSDPPATLACAPRGTPSVTLESSTLQRIGNDLSVTWRANDVPPASGGYAATISSPDGSAEYTLSVEFVDGDSPSRPTTDINVVWAEPSRVVTATYPLSSLPGIGRTFQWVATLAFGDGDGSFSQCPAGGGPVTYPASRSGA